MEWKFHFAGLDIVLDLPEDRMFSDPRHLGPFETETVTEPHRFRFEVVDAFEAPAGDCLHNEGGFRVYRQGGREVRYIGSVQQSWEAAYIRAEHRGKEHLVQLLSGKISGNIGVHTILGALAAEHLVVENQGVILHASFIAHQGRAILFTAPSGTGKSTQAELWRKYRDARIINGDRAAVCAAGEQVLAEGLPFAGSSQYCESCSLPLAAVVYLQQAPETSITRLTGFRAFSRVWEGCSVNTWNGEDMALASQTLQRVLERVPVYLLACRPDESAVNALEKMLERQAEP